MKRILAAVLCVCLLCVPVYSAPSEKLVALTFDDGPSGRFTRALLDGLAQRDAKVTFFLCGYRIADAPELTERIFREGHEIGLHGYSHKSMQNMTPAEVVEELQKTAALLPSGCKPVFLRCPGGACSQSTRNAAAACGLSLAYWSVDPKDWATDSATAIQKDVLKYTRDGDIILMHDMSNSSVEAALSIIDLLSAQGFRFVTLSELAQNKGVSPVPGVVYSYFR